MTTKAPKIERLTVTTSLPVEAILEFAALCVGGWVSARKIKGEFVDYELAVNNNTIVMTCKKNSEAKRSNLIEELRLLLLGLFSIGAEVEGQGSLFIKEPLSNVILWARSKEFTTPSLDAQIHPLFRITLADLLCAYKYLGDRTIGISQHWNDPIYESAFPFMDVYAGDKGYIRHKSGAEILIGWIGNEFVGTHKFNVPHASEEVLKMYDCQSSGKKFEKKKTPVATKTGPYRKSHAARVKAARILGEVPQQDQKRVFDWFADVFNSVDYFHDTRGGIVLPPIFEIEFNDCKLTATHDFEFELIKPLVKGSD